MAGIRDWVGWHGPYGDPGSELSRRLRLVQGHLAAWLDGRPGERLSVVSVCAEQGRDLVGVLAGRPDAGRVRATLLELDAGNVAAARAAVRAAGLAGVTVVQVDAGERAAYVGAVPADLVLLVGVFGNIGDADVRGTVEALPELCAPGATVIWTRGRRPPDLTGETSAGGSRTPGASRRRFTRPMTRRSRSGSTGSPDGPGPAARCSGSSRDDPPQSERPRSLGLISCHSRGL